MSLASVQPIVCTLVFPIKDSQVLLGFGKKGYNAQKWNGYGGKVDTTDTTIRQTAIRELEEEVGLIAQEADLHYHGYVRFGWGDEVPGLGVRAAREVVVHMYSVTTWQGESEETEAMATPTWFPVANVPLDAMPPDTIYWLSLVFEGKSFVGHVRYNTAREVVQHTVDVVEHVPES